MTRNGGANPSWLAVSALMAPLFAALPLPGSAGLPSILCSAGRDGTSRPASVVTVLRSEKLGNGLDRRMTTLLVHFPPHAFTPRHVHGGALTAYVVSGHVRSQLDAGAIRVLGPGDTFHEAVGTVHSFIENSDDEPADVVATIVHAPHAALTTMVP